MIVDAASRTSKRAFTCAKKRWRSRRIRLWWVAAPSQRDAHNESCLSECRGRSLRDPIGYTADSRTGYTPTEAPILRKKTISESMKLPTAAPVWTGLGTMKTRINMMIKSVDSHFGIQTG
jgi:hypothetical protein